MLFLGFALMAGGLAGSVVSYTPGTFAHSMKREDDTDEKRSVDGTGAEVRGQRLPA